MSCMKGLRLCALPHRNSCRHYVIFKLELLFVEIPGAGRLLRRISFSSTVPCAQTQTATRGWLSDLKRRRLLYDDGCRKYVLNERLSYCLQVVRTRRAIQRDIRHGRREGIG
jgi:hypothetical protein